MLLFVISIAYINFPLTLIYGTEDTEKAPPLKVKLTTDSKWIATSLKIANEYRKIHNSPPLKHNNTLSEMSQSYANFLLSRALSTDNGAKSEGDVSFFDHNLDVMNLYNVGENLYYLTAYYEALGPALSPNIWYNEIKDYDFETGGPKYGTEGQIGHFTQLIWASSSEFGSAFATSKLSNNQTITFVVAYYYPRGNMFLDGTGNGLYLENVKKPVQFGKIETGILKTIQRYNVLMTPNVTTPFFWTAAAAAKQNDYRSNHGVPELLINDQLCQTSQFRSDLLLKEGIGQFNANRSLSYSKNGILQFGENVLYFLLPSSEEIDASIPINLWYGERSFWNTSGGNNWKSDQFQQLIWKSTSAFCITFSSGLTENGQNLVFFVAHYFPSGQGAKSIKEKKENVLHQNLPKRERLTWSSSGGILSVLRLDLLLLLTLNTNFIFFK